MAALTKAERLGLIMERLLKLSPASSADEACAHLVCVVNEVEDELSGAPYAPERWMQDGRMYPPLPDSERTSRLPESRRFVTKLHDVYLGTNGAIAFHRRSDAACVFSKPGADGKEIGA